MTDRTSLPREESQNTPVKTMFAGVPTAEEIDRWLGVTFQILGKGGKLPLLHDDLRLIGDAHVNAQYHPLWYIKNRILSGYICWEQTKQPSTLFSSLADGRSLYDIIMLNKAIQILQAMQARKEQTLLIVPIHVRTLCDRRAREFFRFYCELHAANFSRSLVFMVQGLDEQRMLEPDFENVQRIHSFCRALILQTSYKNDNIARYVRLRPHACGFALDDFKGDEEQLFEHINKYAESCEKAGMKSFITGVDKVSIMTAAIGAGITYLQGHTIGEEVTQPRHVEFMGIDSVYKQIFPEQTKAAILPEDPFTTTPPTEI
ncbi:MAG: hypothetical protein KKA05_05000 [Alphaproteobacteria bacterium]|nr:hypothetical protein [Alphaproteobacteria bacterium]MBU0859539.1 hypothetical protein [Alphaproteobacteria bacterium]